MPIIVSLCLALVMFEGALAGQADRATDWDRADEATIRLQPSELKELPGPIQNELERRGCTIPQVHSGAEPGNVVRGRFTSPDQVDVAVLCSRDRVSSILVFRGESVTSVAELAPQPDRNYLQGIGGGRIGFSRALGAADPQYIQEHYEAYGGPRPPPLNQDGINDIFMEKASVVWYWHEGQWLQLTGAD